MKRCQQGYIFESRGSFLVRFYLKSLTVQRNGSNVHIVSVSKKRSIPSNRDDSDTTSCGAHGRDQRPSHSRQQTDCV
jgi:hypothetical protein